ncbi:Protein FATTY ACID EXPORT like [Actinidia chinensis var. chinensis]|uniref:Protein FATTY ACID EXPORT like n=1 Tax=Actinidia chinensis var. chinensis TaxID=1590841 RepID=A0A2R6PRJ5_ACTCC|nr:Protein FATTY ACID EXPORT like [Actinidia chinensis var. chinensis]
MHDFCFTIPYGLIVVCGGLLGYATKGSTSSLAGGAGTGFLLVLAGYLSLRAFGKQKNSYLALILETACAATLTWVMGQRYTQTSKIIPAGLVAGISALMTGFYIYKIATGGNRIPPKTE